MPPPRNSAAMAEVPGSQGAGPGHPAPPLTTTRTTGEAALAASVDAAVGPRHWPESTTASKGLHIPLVVGADASVPSEPLMTRAMGNSSLPKISHRAKGEAYRSEGLQSQLGGFR